MALNQLSKTGILQLLANDRDAAFATLLQNSLNIILKAESAAQLKAEPYERTEERTGSRNGFRDRPLTTRIGTIILHVPKHRNGEAFHTLIFDNYSRSEAALIVTMAEMVVNGVSTRKVSQVLETLCGKTYSKSTVSEACKELDKRVREFRERPLTGEYPFLTVDATYFKVRDNGRIIPKAFMIAYATNSEGQREIIGFGIYANESKQTWNAFLNSNLTLFTPITNHIYRMPRYSQVTVSVTGNSRVPVRFHFIHPFRCPLKFALFIHLKICCHFQDTPAFLQYTDQPLIQICIIISKINFTQVTSDRESQPFFFQRKVGMNILFISP